jgi:hypothetical protein
MRVANGVNLCACGCGEVVTNVAKRTNTKRGRIKGQPYKFIHGHGRHKGTVEQRFWSRVDKNGPVHPVLGTRCWLWTGCTADYGYGIVNTGDIITTAHREAWFLTYGKWPENLACHHCDNPPCVRPEHLFDGDHDANSKDMLSKGRFPNGEEHWFAKLTDKEVAEIREKRGNGALQRELASEYRVSKTCIWHLLNDRRQPKEIQ